jgi:hypothetical protein
VNSAFGRWLAIRLIILAAIATAAGVAFGSGAAVLVVALAWVAAIAQLRMALPARLPLPARPRRPAATADWPSLERVSSELTWAATSQRHYDLGLRRIMQRVAAARLDSRAGVDLWSARDAAAAERLIGAQSWPLIDPSRPASTDSHGRGVDGRQVDALLDRLDALRQGMPG